MSRNGKIARLPKHIREQLNRRLEDGEQGDTLLEWLNGLPEVQEILKKQFGGMPINKQSLSQWRLGGHQDWLRHEESCRMVRQLAEEAGDLNTEANDVMVGEMLADLMSVELARAFRAMLAETAEPREKWRQLQEFLSQLSQLRRADHRTARLRMDQERWDLERERLEKEEWARQLQKAKNKALAPFWDLLKRGPLAEFFGGGETGEKIAEHIIKVQNMDLPESWERRVPVDAGSDLVRPGQSESDQNEYQGC
jgi:hypothetical protein